MIISSLLENGVAAFRFGRRDWLVIESDLVNLTQQY